MKKLLLITAVFSMIFAGVSGCCSPSRDVSTPSKALLGHWKNTIPGMNPDIYYGAEKVSYDRKKNGDVTSVPYEVESENQEEFSLEISYQGASERTRISFSKDRNTITVLPPNVPELFRYEYADTQQKP